VFAPRELGLGAFFAIAAKIMRRILIDQRAGIYERSEEGLKHQLHGISSWLPNNRWNWSNRTNHWNGSPSSIRDRAESSSCAFGRLTVEERRSTRHFY
jgi:hypothetical protein